jgi:RimJ/RimL family protein N-acetyltransferase
MNFLIRQANARDAESILSLTVTGIQTWGRDIWEELAPWTEEICNLIYVKKRLSNSHYKNFVAEQNEEIVGSIYLNLEDADTAYMGGLYCSLKRSGIGSALLHKAMDESKECGYARMNCEIYSGNTPSIALMTKNRAVYSHSELFDDVEYQTYSIKL